MSPETRGMKMEFRVIVISHANGEACIRDELTVVAGKELGLVET